MGTKAKKKINTEKTKVPETRNKKKKKKATTASASAIMIYPKTNCFVRIVAKIFLTFF
jgi:hypothetical protein